MIEIRVFQDGRESRIWVGRNGQYMPAYSSFNLPEWDLMPTLGILLADLRSALYDDIHILFNPEVS